MIRAANLALRAWAKERRKQMPDNYTDIGQQVPDKEAMQNVMNEPMREVFTTTCECSCHDVGV